MHKSYCLCKRCSEMRKLAYRFITEFIFEIQCTKGLNGQKCLSLRSNIYVVKVLLCDIVHRTSPASRIIKKFFSCRGHFVRALPLCFKHFYPQIPLPSKYNNMYIFPFILEKDRYRL